MMKTLLTLIALTVALKAELPMKPGERVLFLGDSITQDGKYVAMIEAALIASAPEVKLDLISAGLSSETVSGLSEPGHADGKFPRPDLHERLDRVLEGAKPKVVVACYGMNCGIYMPLKEERFKAYRDGIMKLREKATAMGARVIHLTPPLFDAEPIKDRTDPSGAEGENFKKPFTGYNEVLDAYSDWLLAQRKEGWEVIDLHGPMKQALAEGRAKDPAFFLSKDGVHPGVEGHAIMAQAVLAAWGVKVSALEVATQPENTALWKAVQAKQNLLKAAWLTKTGHKRPGVAAGLPLPEAEAKAAEQDAQARQAVKAG